MLQQRDSDEARETAVVFLPPVIDMISSHGVRANLAAAVQSGATVVLVDMSATISCDCEGAYSLAQAHRDAAAAEVELRLVAPSAAVLGTLALLDLKERVSVYESLDEALPRLPEVPLASAQSEAPPPQAYAPETILARPPGRHEASRTSCTSPTRPATSW